MNKKNNYEYMGTTIQNIKYGSLEGIINKKSNTLAWMGIPYAKPPVGELRWQAPKTPDKWDGILKTKKFQNASIQAAYGRIKGSEDCLYLNIWRPNTTEENLPVLVFVHGGGNRTNSGESFKGNLLAEKTNSIIISINYRLGAMGWFRHPSLKTGNPIDDSGNYGLLDVIQSLKWVKENIESFGGNPNNLTLSGQSAGARDVLACLISPLAKNLFNKAMAFSGGMTLSEAEDGDKMGEAVLVQLLINDGTASNWKEAKKWLNSQSKENIANYLKSKNSKDFLNLYGSSLIKMDSFPHLFKDGYVIPKEGFDLLKLGDYTKVPIILGSTASEFSLYAFMDPYFYKSCMNRNIFKDLDKLDLYKKTLDYGSKIYSGFNVENVASLLVKNLDQPSVYGYRFAWGTRPEVIKPPVDIFFGATHISDMDFVTGHEDFFINILFPDSIYFQDNKPGREDLSNIMANYIKNFLYSSNPNGENLPEWNPWIKDRALDKILRLDADKNHAVIEMSKEYYDKDEIIVEMENNLSEDTKNTIIENFLKGCFFWDLWKY